MMFLEIHCNSFSNCLPFYLPGLQSWRGLVPGLEMPYNHLLWGDYSIIASEAEFLDQSECLIFT